MQLAVRPYITSGVALVGASVIAVAPVAVAPPDVQLPEAAISTAAVNLTAAVDPISAYLTLVQNTLENLSTQASNFLANPAPILQQVLANQLANGTAAFGALSTFGTELVNNMATMWPDEFQQAVNNLFAGDIVGVGHNLVDAIVQPALIPALSLLPTLGAVIEAPFANMLAVSQQFVTIGALAGLGTLSPLASVINSNAQAIQNIVDAAGSADPIGVLSAFAAAPAIVIDGIVNGFSPDGGLINPGLSVLSALHNIITTIATAITPAAPVAAAAEPAAIASPTSKAAASVTMNVAAKNIAADHDSADIGATATKSAATAKSSTDTESPTTKASATKDTNGDASVDIDAAKSAEAAAGSSTAKGSDATTDTHAAKDTNDAGTNSASETTTETDDTTATAGAAEGGHAAKDTKDTKTDSKSGDSK
jgi:hypothetical protein